MIVHSTANQLDDTCLVQVEGIESGQTDAIVGLFAQGAAAKHNAGFDFQVVESVEWCDDHGRPLTAGSDTTDSTIARVLCRIEAP